jgi:hypothetical protein
MVTVPKPSGGSPFEGKNRDPCMLRIDTTKNFFFGWMPYRMAKYECSQDLEGLVVKYFDPNVMPSGSTSFLIGKRGTGKTKLIVDILAFHRNVSYCVVICPTIEANTTYAKHTPGLFIHKTWTPDIVDKIVAAQQALGDRVKEFPCLLVFDDCLFDPKFSKDISTRNLYMNGRHANITVVCAGQYMLDLPPAIRTNTDYVFVLADNNRSNREKIFKNFGGAFRSFRAFDEVMRKCTEDHHCLVLDNQTTSNTLADCIAYYKATLGLRYHIGTQELWDFAEQASDPTPQLVPSSHGAAHITMRPPPTSPTRRTAGSSP